MSYNYAKLLGRIVEVFGTQAKFAEAMDLSEHTVSAKLNGKAEWKQGEISRACSLLGIAEQDIHFHFFAI